MPLPGKKAFLNSWLTNPELSSWLINKNGAFCKLCNCALRPHLSDLIKHSSTAKHKLRANEINTTKCLTRMVAPTPEENTVQMKRHQLELRIALHCASQCSFRSLDTLGSILQEELGTVKESVLVCA